MHTSRGRRGWDITRVQSNRIRLSGPHRSRGTSHRNRALHHAGRPFQRLHHGPHPFKAPVTGGMAGSSPHRGGRTVSAPLPRGLPVPLTGPRRRGVHGVSSPFTIDPGVRGVPAPLHTILKPPYLQRLVFLLSSCSRGVELPGLLQMNSHIIPHP